MIFVVVKVYRLLPTLADASSLFLVNKARGVSGIKNMRVRPPMRAGTAGIAKRNLHRCNEPLAIIYVYS